MRPRGAKIKVNEAVQQADDERWQCLTCTGPAEEHGDYCWHCKMYWDDCASGLWEDAE